MFASNFAKIVQNPFQNICHICFARYVLTFGAKGFPSHQKKKKKDGWWMDMKPFYKKLDEIP
jgi:hypothetical protein